MKKPQPINEVIENLTVLPGIGPRMAERTAYFLLKQGSDFIDRFVAALLGLKSLVRCGECHAVGEKNPCDICADVGRDRQKLAVVESPADIEALERTRKYGGLYFVLGGLISPLDGVNVSDIPVDALKERIKKTDVKEVIVATDPNTKGETTALFLTEALKDSGVKITRLAYGLPFGGDLEYADEITLGSAIEGRKEIKKTEKK